MQLLADGIGRPTRSTQYEHEYEYDAVQYCTSIQVDAVLRTGLSVAR